RDPLVTGVQTCALPILPPLALRVDRVEGKRGLPGAGEPGDANEAVPRQADGDVLEVVLAGAVNYELVRGHNRPSLARRIGSNKRSEERRVGKGCKASRM